MDPDGGKVVVNVGKREYSSQSVSAGVLLGRYREVTL